MTDSNEDMYYYAQDHLYSPTALIDESGDVVERYEYNAYGSAMIYNSDFSKTYAVSQYGNPYLFTGRRMDSFDSHARRLGFYRNRYLDYYTGRWLTHDPLGITPNPTMPNEFEILNQYNDGTNLYEYAKSDPTNNADPWGLHIYLKTGNNSGNPINDAIHQNVCVDTTCNQDGNNLACFSFGKTGWMLRFGARYTWLDWNSYTLGGLLMKGEIYESADTGKVVSTKRTTWSQDYYWLKWMRQYRVGTVDVYSVGRHNCRLYSQWEFNDAP